MSQSVVTPWRATAAPAPSGDGAPPAEQASRAPLSSAPQISKVAASNDGGRELQEDLARAEAGVAGAADQADHAAVRDRDPLGPAGRARGVDHIGQRLGRRPPAAEPALAGLRRRPPPALGVHERRGRARPAAPASASPAVDDQQAEPGVRAHEGQALRGIGRGRAARRRRRP